MISKKACASAALELSSAQTSDTENSSNSSTDYDLSRSDRIIFSIFFLSLAAIAITVAAYACYKIKVKPCLDNARERASKSKENILDEIWIEGQKKFDKSNDIWKKFEQKFKEFISCGESEESFTREEKALFGKLIQEIIYEFDCSSRIKEKLKNGLNLEVYEFNEVIKIWELKLFCPVSFQRLILPSTAGNSLGLYERDTLKKCKTHPETREKISFILIDEKAQKYVEDFFSELENIYLTNEPLVQNTQGQNSSTSTPFANYKSVSASNTQVSAHNNVVSNSSFDERTRLIPWPGSG